MFEVPAFNQSTRTVSMLTLAILIALVSQLRLHAQSAEEFPEDIDGLFSAEQNDAASNSESSSESESADSALSVLESVTPSERLDASANFRISGGYSPGWDEQIGALGRHRGLAVVEVASGFNLQYNVSDNFSVRQRAKVEYPDYEPELTEFSFDLVVAQRVFVTAGLLRVNWGRSPNFPVANVLNRRADTTLSSVDTQNSIVARIVIPIGVGGIELVLQNKDEYHSNPDQPRGDRIGAGVKYNLAIPRLDVDFGGYYQRGLRTRLFTSLSTTLNDWLELYAQGVYADSRFTLDETGPYVSLRAGERGPNGLPLSSNGNEIPRGLVEIAPGRFISDNNPDYAVGLGLVSSLLQNAIDLNIEYLYNGEETENVVSGARFPLFWGHNFALNLDWDIPNTPMRLRAGVRHNASLDSTLILPRLTISVVKNLQVEIFGATLLGQSGTGYQTENPDELDRATFFGFAATVSGSVR